MLTLSDTSGRTDVTRLLRSLNAGESQAVQDLLPAVYQELRRIAAASMRARSGSHTLQPTALIHELYLRLLQRDLPELKDRAHFFALASRIMRQILVDNARRKSAKKRNLQIQVELSEPLAAVLPPATQVLDVDAALDRLAAIAPRQAQILELRYFGGLDLNETAEALGISVPTIVRETRLAEAWLARDLTAGPTPPANDQEPK